MALVLAEDFGDQLCPRAVGVFVSLVFIGTPARLGPASDLIAEIGMEARESDIQRAICEYLELRKHFFWR
jgi:hypothetical protein